MGWKPNPRNLQSYHRITVSGILHDNSSIARMDGKRPLQLLIEVKKYYKTTTVLWFRALIYGDSPYHDTVRNMKKGDHVTVWGVLYRLHIPSKRPEHQVLSMVLARDGLLSYTRGPNWPISLKPKLIRGYEDPISPDKTP